MSAVDLLLFAALVTLGGAALLARELRAAVILFIAFGLLLALGWARLAAPDVALAEAAIGAGVTGALLLDAVAQLHAPGTPSGARRPLAPALFVAAGGACLAIAAALAAAVFPLPPSSAEAAELALRRLPATEVAHPVTGVLLAFRAYDTLLEIGVLLVAVIAASTLPPPLRTAKPLARDPVLARVVSVTLPIAALMAVYLLWAGATRTGGAFQAGAVLAGAILLARFAGTELAPIGSPAIRRALLGMGFAVFVIVGIAAGAAAGAVLAYPEGWGGVLILAIEAALMVSIGLSLVELFGPKGATR